MSTKPQPIKTAHVSETDGRTLCNECYNKQNPARGARPAGWAPDDEPRVQCEECGCEALAPDTGPMR